MCSIFASKCVSALHSGVGNSTRVGHSWRAGSARLTEIRGYGGGEAESLSPFGRPMQTTKFAELTVSGKLYLHRARKKRVDSFLCMANKYNVRKTVQFIKRCKGDTSSTENSKNQLRAEPSCYIPEPPLHDEPF